MDVEESLSLEKEILSKLDTTLDNRGILIATFVKLVAVQEAIYELEVKVDKITNG